MRDTTLLFLTKTSETGVITDICLAMKKRGFGAGRWNGTGGKTESGETIKDAVVRETQEEIGVTVSDMSKVAELTFTFPHKPEWDQLVHVFFADEYAGTPTESEEMKPAWFAVVDIPYDDMWPDDRLWLPHVLEGKYVRAAFSFAEGDVIVSQEVNIVTEL